MPPFAVPADFADYRRQAEELFSRTRPPRSTATSPSCARPTSTACSTISRASPTSRRGAPRAVHRAREARRALSAIQRLKALLMADTPHWGSLPDRTSYMFDAMLRLLFPRQLLSARQLAEIRRRSWPRRCRQRGGQVLKCAAVEAHPDRQRQGTRRAHPHGFEARRPRTSNSARPWWSRTPTRCTPTATSSAKNIAGAGPIEHLKSMTPSFPCFLVHLGLRGMDPKAARPPPKATTGRPTIRWMPSGTSSRFSSRPISIRIRAARLPDPDRAEADAGAPREDHGLAGA